MEKKVQVRNQIVKFTLFIGISALLILLDQWSKNLASLYLKGQEDIILWPGVFQLHYLENQGIAFGLFQGKQWIFAIFTFFVLILLGIVVAKMKLKKRYIPAFAVVILLTSGAVGNLIDRLFLNYVVDFFYFSLIDFPVFNVADIYVTVSCFGLILLLLIYQEDELLEILPGKKEKNKDENK